MASVKVLKSSKSSGKRKRQDAAAKDEYLDLPEVDGPEDVPNEEETGRSEKASKKDKKEKKSKGQDKKKDKKKKQKEQQPSQSAESTTTTTTQSSSSGSKKRKLDSDTAAAADAQPTNTNAATAENSNISSKPSKKRKKNKTATTDSVPATTTTTTTTTTDADADADTAAPKTGKEEAQEQQHPQKQHRFIVFVGNLPFSATTTHIEAHFAAVHPTSVRLLTKTYTTKAGAKRQQSRGAAFVEFAGYDHMKTCLKTLHHSTLKCPAVNAETGEPLVGNKVDERRINVELTAGGGGNTAFRREKIRTKNDRLNEQRARRAQAEALEKAAKQKKKQAESGEGEAEEAADGIHPSRRAQMAS